MQEDQGSEDLPFGSRGGIAVHHYFPVDGEYVVKVRLKRQIYDYILGLDRPEQLDVRVDGEKVRSFVLGGEDHGPTAPQTFGGDVLGSPGWERYALTADEGLEVRLPVRAGPRVVGVSYVGKSIQPEGVLQPRERYGEYSRDETGDQAVESMAISGPFRTTGPGDTPSRRKILSCRPRSVSAEEACATRILSGLARAAFRRPPTDAEMKTVIGFFKSGRSEATFDAGLQFAIQRILADPGFLFRVAEEPAGLAAGASYRIPDLELASRLSFFLWSSVPDGELLDLATRGKLGAPGVLEAQVQRMLADSRSSALIENFAGQWLLLRNLKNISPTPDLFPDFDESLRAVVQARDRTVSRESASRRPQRARAVERELHFRQRTAGAPLRHHQRSRLELPTRHARRRQSSSRSARAGQCADGDLVSESDVAGLTREMASREHARHPATAAATERASLKERRENGQPGSVRQLLEEHRKNPSCAVCHAPMDPLGFALENFDAIGQWRTRDGGATVDASAALPGDVRFEGPDGLRTVLLERRVQFVDTVAEKLLAYALGRGLQYYDRPVVRRITRHAESSDYRWSAVTTAIVKSTPFQMRKTRSVPAQASRE
jgi:hypothetical protein